VSKDRAILARLIKNWAQDHSHNFIIASDETGDDGVSQTGSFLAGVVLHEGIGLDLVGMFCRKCKTFYKYAEGNQPDGSLLCYSCRSNPYT
jgi:hypothetical protein